MKEILETINKNLYISIAIILIGITVYMLLKKLTNKIIEKNKENQKIDKRKRTYMRLLRNIFKYLIIIIVCVLLLQVNGVNVGSLIAGLGVVSVIAGLALQDALKDIIMGFNIIIDNYFSVGDVLEINDIDGKVIELGLKATKLKDINNGNIFTISNRNITEALNISNQLDIDVPLPYEENINKVEKILKEDIIEQLKQIENINKVEYKGINEFASSAIYYKIRIYCKPELHPQIKRNANRIIKLELDKNKINIPYTQLDLHIQK